MDSTAKMLRFVSHGCWEFKTFLLRVPLSRMPQVQLQKSFKIGLMFTTWFNPPNPQITRALPLHQETHQRNAPLWRCTRTTPPPHTPPGPRNHDQTRSAMACILGIFEKRFPGPIRVLLAMGRLRFVKHVNKNTPLSCTSIM